jgi:leader peptidase (prepilin peptidase)/N-methyltransferase
MATLPVWLFFAFGACIGSFLNVCAYRIPAGLSIATPPSRCPHCGTPVRPADNIPVISWFLLGGSCRYCASGISIRYALVEAATGLLAVLVYWRFGLSLPALIYFGFGALLVTASLIDLDYRIIPNVFTLPGIPLALTASLLLPEISVKEAFAGMVAGGGSLWLVAVVYRRFRGREGMGMGDVKLLALIGALVGPEGVLFTVLAASIMGTMAGLLAALRHGKGLQQAIPFGPFLASGAIVYLFFGTRLILWYRQFLVP